MQNFVATTFWETLWDQNKILIEFELWWKKNYGILMSARTTFTKVGSYSNGRCGYYCEFLKITSPSMACAIDQSHRYGCPQAACREPAGSYDKTTRSAICFEHKTQYLLIRAPYTRIVVFWHINNIPPMISQSQISCNTPTFYIAAIFVKYCHTTGIWLL